MVNITLEEGRCGLMVLDMQDRLLEHLEERQTLVKNVCATLSGCRAFHLPVIVTEQYPEGLGHTSDSVKQHLARDQRFYPKKSFSAMATPEIVAAMEELSYVHQWILVGIETHVSILQTAKALVKMGKQVVVLNDATTTKSIYDLSTAIDELKGIGVRISTHETVLFELLRTVCAPQSADIGFVVG
jgi:nicotinamidase-related amidase